MTRSTGTGAVLPGSAARSASTRPLTASTSAGLVGPRFEPLELAALFAIGEVAEGRESEATMSLGEGRPQKFFGSLKLWPISSEPTTLPSRSTRLPAAWLGNATRAMPVMANG